MLYYYKVKKKRRPKRWITLCALSVAVWAYFYPGSLANVLPKIDTPGLSSLAVTRSVPSSIVRSRRVTPPKPAEEVINIAPATRVAFELREEGKDKEASELKYSLDMLAKITSENDTDSPVMKARVRAIKLDIIKTASYFKAGNAASKKPRILGGYDGGNLAYVYYPNYGVHHNPVTTCNAALSEYGKGNHKKVVAVADDLLKIAVERDYPGVGPYYIWEYYFDLEYGDKFKLNAPWPSGMAQGLVLDIMGKAYKITGDPKYKIAGSKILNSFRVPWNEGGVTESDEHGNWYLEVAATDKLRILNGFLFTLYSINNYYEVTGDVKALRLFDAGVKEAQAHIHEYDLGYWSNYSILPGERASYGYHKIHADLLQKLYALTGIPEFKTYGDKFEFYRKHRFFDIAPSHPSFKQITALAERNIIVGNEGWFGASAEIGKAELIGWIARARGWKPSTTYKGYYGDIKRDRADWGYIEAAYDRGLKLGDEHELFKPDAHMTRAEVAGILCKAFAVDAGKPPVPVADLASAGAHQGDVELALSNGLMDVYQPNYFRPSYKVTRQQAALILYKLVIPQAAGE